MRFSAAALALIALSAPAGASDWKVVAAKSWLGFKGDAGGVPFEGRFARWEARIAFDPADPEHGHVDVTVDTATAAIGDSEADAALPQPAWFDAKAFPAATLTAQSFQPKGANAYDAVGTLALRGVTKPIVMPVTIDVKDDVLHASGRLDLVRTDYGVGASVGAQWVGLGVVASFDVTAERVR